MTVRIVVLVSLPSGCRTAGHRRDVAVRAMEVFSGGNGKDAKQAVSVSRAGGAVHKVGAMHNGSFLLDGLVADVV